MAKPDVKQLIALAREIAAAGHLEVEDCWYSCPLADNYCGDQDRDECFCWQGDMAKKARAALKGKE